VVSRQSRFTPAEELPVPIGSEAGWGSDLVWTKRLDEKFFALPGNEPRSSSLWPDTIVTELPQLLLGMDRRIYRVFHEE
jgi:hypothetical protein